MKKIFASVVFVVATFTLSCSQVPKNENAQSVFGPTIEFEMQEYDFGTIPHNGDGAISFKFTNTGTEPLVLSNVRSSCGCTIPEWPREPINVGGSAEILVKYDTNRSGSFNKSISVFTNASETPVVLRIKGSVEAAAAATGS